MDWEKVKAVALVWYGKAAAVFLFQNLLGFIAACVVAGHPVGVTGYVGFLYHCCQWRGL